MKVESESQLCSITIKTTDNRQSKILVNTKLKPRLIKVESRFALLNRKVATRMGVKTWPLTICKVNQM